MSKVIFQTPELLKTVETILDDHKAIDLVTLALGKYSSIAEYFVIASGTSTRHVAALAQYILEKAGPHAPFVQIEGLEQSQWVLIDLGEIIVHLFTPETRVYYNLEDMWSTPSTAESSGD